MASNKARDSRLSPRAMLIWLVITMQPVNASQSQYQNIPAPSKGKVAAAGSQHLRINSADSAMMRKLDIE